MPRNEIERTPIFPEASFHDDENTSPEEAMVSD
jgi:hypothetical protein